MWYISTIWVHYITHDARCTNEIKSRISTAQAAARRRLFHLNIGPKFKEETSEMLHLEHAFV
jgi:hypothetical protein